jgi:hypothetical protein
MSRPIHNWRLGPDKASGKVRGLPLGVRLRMGMGESTAKASACLRASSSRMAEVTVVCSKHAAEEKGAAGAGEARAAGAGRGRGEGPHGRGKRPQQPRGPSHLTRV